MARGRFRIHDPEETRFINLRVPRELHEQITKEVKMDRTTMTAVLNQIITDGIMERRLQRVKKFRIKQERLAALAEAEKAVTGR